MPPAVLIVIGIVVLIFVLALLAILFTYFNLWLQAYFSKARVSIFAIILMRFRKVNPQAIVINKIKLVCRYEEEKDGKRKAERWGKSVTETIVMYNEAAKTLLLYIFL